MATLYFKGGRLFEKDAFVRGDLWIADGLIAEAQDHYDHCIDATGLLITPGYIDLQVNGAIGLDLTQNPENIPKVADFLITHGVTSFLATFITSPFIQYPEKFAKITIPSPKGAELIGVHLEGPLLSRLYAGAHNQEWMIDCDQIDFSLMDNPVVKLITIAPENPAAISALNYFKRKGAVISAGHTGATIEQLNAAVKNSLSMVTHIYNAMAPFHHRNPGPIGYTLAHSELFFSIIADGIHVHPEAVRMAFNANPNKLILVSDSSAACGMPPGEYFLGSQPVTLAADGSVCLKGAKTLAGSSLTLDKAVINLRNYADCSAAQAVHAATYAPAEVLGLLPYKGTLANGIAADINILDTALNVIATYKNGELVYKTGLFNF